MSNLFNIPEIYDGEEWRGAVGFENYYQVSTRGRVKALARTTVDGRHLRDHLIKPTGARYKSVAFNIDGKVYNKLVHRLVAEAFIPNPDNLPEVNHLDSDTSNNYAENLEWVSASSNHGHSVVNRSKKYSYRIPVRCLETNEIFPSISAAGRSVNADATQIVESIQSQGCCKGFTFVYEDSLPQDIEAYVEAAHARYEDHHKRPLMRNSRRVRVVETREIFDSIAATARYYQVDASTVADRIREHRTVRGLTFEFVE